MDRYSGLTAAIAEVRALFPEMGDKSARYFGAALYNEDKGQTEKAESFLEKAIAAEEAEETE